MKKLVWLAAISVFLLNSCLTPRKVVYLDDMKENTAYNTLIPPPVRVQKGDRLSIQVSAKNQELTAPFNQGLGSYRITDDGNVATENTGVLQEKGFLVDQEGKIDYPIVGSLAVEGLTLDGLKDLVRDRLTQGNLLSDPIVSVELLNLKINMMGEVGSIGVITVPDGRITLIEAIARAGGLTSNAAVDKIAVIREENGERKMIMNNIESKAIFDSPTYYLQQNDIVYVTPRSARFTPREENTWRFIGSGVGLITMFFTLLNYTNR